MAVIPRPREMSGLEQQHPLGMLWKVVVKHLFSRCGEEPACPGATRSSRVPTTAMPRGGVMGALVSPPAPAASDPL